MHPIILHWFLHGSKACSQQYIIYMHSEWKNKMHGCLLQDHWLIHHRLRQAGSVNLLSRSRLDNGRGKFPKNSEKYIYHRPSTSIVPCRTSSFNRWRPTTFNDRFRGTWWWTAWWWPWRRTRRSRRSSWASTTWRRRCGTRRPTPSSPTAATATSSTTHWGPGARTASPCGRAGCASSAPSPGSAPTWPSSSGFPSRSLLYIIIYYSAQKSKLYWLNATNVYIIERMFLINVILLGFMIIRSFACSTLPCVALSPGATTSSAGSTDTSCILQSCMRHTPCSKDGT